MTETGDVNIWGFVAILEGYRGNINILILMILPLFLSSIREDFSRARTLIVELIGWETVVVLGFLRGLAEDEILDVHGRVIGLHPAIILLRGRLELSLDVYLGSLVEKFLDYTDETIAPNDTVHPLGAFLFLSLGVLP